MERQVARLVSQGMSNKEVAAQCWVSPRTVEFHLRNLFTKTGVTSRGGLAHLDLGVAQPAIPVAAVSARVFRLGRRFGHLPRMAAHRVVPEPHLGCAAIGVNAARVTARRSRRPAPRGPWGRPACGPPSSRAEETVARPRPTRARAGRAVVR